jgi:hypothetical protein
MNKALLPLLLLSAAAHAQTSPATTSPVTAPPAITTPGVNVNAVLTQPNQQPMTMPLNVQLLPYGTVEIARNAYFIPNFEGTGISIYIQTPYPIRIATLEETTRFQAEWLRLTQAIHAPTPVTPAAVSSRAVPSLAVQPLPTPATPSALGAPPAGPLTATTAKTAAPTPALGAPAVTLLPNWLQVSFKGRQNRVTFLITNTSDVQRMTIDPRTLRVYQGQTPVRAELAVRDSINNEATGTLLPRSALVGTLTVDTKSKDALTVTWMATDETGRTYPITYSWLPQQ